MSDTNTQSLYNLAHDFGQVMPHCSLWVSCATSTTFWMQPFLGVYESFTAGFIVKMGANTNENDSHFSQSHTVNLEGTSDSDGYVISA